MSAALHHVRLSLKRNLRPVIALALLVGVAGGAVIAAASGASRTDSAYQRFLVASDAVDVAMPIFPWYPISNFDVAKVRALPQVAQADLITNFFTEEGPTIGATGDGSILRKLKIVEGRRPDPTSTDELLLAFSASELLHVGVGGTLDVSVGAVDGSNRPPIRHRFRVVGLSITAADFPPVETTVPTWAAGFATPAFYTAFVKRTSNYQLLAVRLRHGSADLAAFEDGLAGTVGGRGFYIFRERDHTANVEKPIHLQALALWLLGLLIGVSAFLIISQAVARQLSLEAVEYPTLRALGMGPGQLWFLGMARAGVVALIGAAVALGVAFLLSPLTPIGIARTAEPSPGFAMDGDILAVGIAAIIVAVLLLAVWPAWRAARLRTDGERHSARPSIASRLGGLRQPSVAVGVRLALEPGRGRTAVPVRTTIAAVTIAVAALVVAFGLGGSLTHLSNTPRLYGFTWDASLFVEEGVSTIADELAADPRIEAFSGSSGGHPISVGTVPIQAMVLEGSVVLPILEGREPRGPAKAHEILLGTKTLAATGARVGDIIPVHPQGSSAQGVQMRIVGVAVFPPLGAGQGLSKGALITVDAAKALFPGAIEAGAVFDNELAVKFVPGTRQAAFADLQRRLDHDARLHQPQPEQIKNFGRVDNLPVVLAAGLALLAAATMAHVLITAVRRRARDLAVLKTLGFVRSQVRWSIAWQATTLAVVSLLIGLPLGFAASRWAWIVFAHNLGVIPESRMPILALLLTIPGAIVLANLLAAFPARLANRARPAVVLRAE